MAYSILSATMAVEVLIYGSYVMFDFYAVNKDFFNN